MVVMVIVRLMALMLVATSAFALPKEANNGVTILAVVDGDTIKIEKGSKSQNARLKFIDTPEIWKYKCPAELKKGQKAKMRLTQILNEAKAVRINFHGKGYYGRPLITIKADGKDVGKTLMREKLAIPYKKGERHRKDLWC